MAAASASRPLGSRALHLRRLHNEIGVRPAAARVNALREKHAFKAEMDDEARRHMFRHLTRRAA